MDEIILCNSFQQLSVLQMVELVKVGKKIAKCRFVKNYFKYEKV